VIGTSDADGVVTITTRLKGMTDIRFCINDITKPGYVYEPGPLICAAFELPAASGGG
jgi:hypothetical protein